MRKPSETNFWKKIKEVSKEQQKDIVERIANDYIMYASWYKDKN